MALSALSLEQAPPISVPLRFFLTAPLFAFLAAGVLLFAGPDAFASRWTPALLAATHLLTLGFLTMCMIGALSQMLPVLAGAVITKPRRGAWLTHAPLVAGTLLLAGGFLFGWRAGLLAALPMLAWSLLSFALVAGLALRRSPARSATIAAMKLALIALAATVLLGLLLGLAVTGHAALPLPRLTNLHAGWGLLGWVGLLTFGVAYQVVPMFQLTTAYPSPMQRLLAPLLAAALLAWSLASWLDVEGGKWMGLLILAPGFAAFATITLQRQHKRRRRVPDVTLQFWRIGMFSVLGAVALWSLAQFEPAWVAAASYPLALGVLLIAGFALSVINGMLYKIVPFVVWLHVQSRNPPRGSVPNMKEIIGDAAARRQAWAHDAALALLLCATLRPDLFLYPAAVASGLSSMLLEWNLFGAWRAYRRFAR